MARFGPEQCAFRDDDDDDAEDDEEDDGKRISMKPMRQGVALATLLGLVSACSDPVAPEPKGAWTATFSATSAVAGSNCTLGGHNAGVGDATAKTKSTVTNKQGGSSVVCKVTGEGPFVVDGLVSQDNARLSLTIPAIAADTTAASPAKGSGSFASDKTAGKSFSSTVDNPCEFFPAQQPPLELAPGSAWLGFTCPALTNASTTPPQICSISSGFVVLEDCPTE